MRCQHGADEREEALADLVDPAGLAIAVPDQQLVERAVLAAVHGLLADEARDRATELGVCNLIREVLHGPNEELHALGEQQRERVQERGLVRVAVGPVARHIGESEDAVAAGEVQERSMALRAVAKKLRLSSRTLKRRRAEQGTTFTAIRDDLRRQRALLLVDNRSLAIGEIALTLGYTELPNFPRAFRKWTGVPLIAYRERPR